MILCGDNIERLREFPDHYFHAVVTDPPYGLSFMGKKWDYDVPSIELWREVLRVLKPGGHLLSFGGTRTYHRMVCAIEDSGFEIRDQIMWIYGSGFPKSLDVSKVIDKSAGATREVIGYRDPKGSVHGDAAPDSTGSHIYSGELRSNNAITDDAKRWSGWGTALKPANEPIVLARKPLSEKTVAANVLRWGTGALNVDASRIEAAGEKIAYGATGPKAPAPNAYGKFEKRSGDGAHSAGRWPANVLLGCDCQVSTTQNLTKHEPGCAAALLDEQSGTLKSGAGQKNTRRSNGNTFPAHNANDQEFSASAGGASRFFYVAKASKRERNAGLEGMELRDPPGPKRSTPAEGRTSALGAPRANHHPTVKPIKLMEYLCKLITPDAGVILDPFAGSGSTGVAAKRLGFGFVGLEREAEYCEIAEKRLANA